MIKKIYTLLLLILWSFQIQAQDSEHHLWISSNAIGNYLSVESLNEKQWEYNSNKNIRALRKVIIAPEIQLFYSFKVLEFGLGLNFTQYQMELSNSTYFYSGSKDYTGAGVSGSSYTSYNHAIIAIKDLRLNFATNIKLIPNFKYLDINISLQLNPTLFLNKQKKYAYYRMEHRTGTSSPFGNTSSTEITENDEHKDNIIDVYHAHDRILSFYSPSIGLQINPVVKKFKILTECGYRYYRAKVIYKREEGSSKYDERNFLNDHGIYFKLGLIYQLK